MTADTDERFSRGLARLKEIDGEAGERVVASLADIAPDFARYLVEFPFGDIYSRPGLDLRSREIAVVGALTAMGNAAPLVAETGDGQLDRRLGSQFLFLADTRHTGLGNSENVRRRAR